MTNHVPSIHPSRCPTNDQPARDAAADETVLNDGRGGHIDVEGLDGASREFEGEVAVVVILLILFFAAATAAAGDGDGGQRGVSTHEVEVLDGDVAYLGAGRDDDGAVEGADEGDAVSCILDRNVVL